jgi:hypothetical protein
MRKDSTIVGGITVLLTAVILGGAWYMAQRQAAVPVTPEETTWSTLEPGATGAVGDANTVPNVPAGTRAGRSEQIIECDLPDGSKAFTNAASCAEADFHNRLSIAQPLSSPPTQRPYSGEGYQPPAQQVRSKTKTQKPNLRLTGKSPPSGLNVACTFAVGKALELERALSVAKDPQESIWREDYCEWIEEARSSECSVGPDIFYYGHLCAYGLRASN